MKKNKKIIAMSGFVFAGLLLCGCSGYSTSDGVHENYVGKWQNNPEEYVTISNNGATLHRVLQVNPINTSGKVIVEDVLYLSTTNEWGFYYNGDDKSARFEANDIICFTNMEWKGDKIAYDEMFTKVKFSGFITVRNERTLQFERGFSYTKM